MFYKRPGWIPTHLPRTVTHFLSTMAKPANACSKFNSKDAIRRTGAAPRPVFGGSRHSLGTEGRLQHNQRSRTGGQLSLRTVSRSLVPCWLVPMVHSLTFAPIWLKLTMRSRIPLTSLQWYTPHIPGVVELSSYIQRHNTVFANYFASKRLLRCPGT